MSTPFDINARLVIQSSNIGQVTQQLQTALNKVGAVAGQGAASNLSTRQVVNLTKKLGPLGAQFDKTRASATKFASTMRITAQQLKTVAATVDQAAQSVAKLNTSMKAASNIKVRTTQTGGGGGGGGGGNIVQYNKQVAQSVRRVANEYEEFGRQIVITGKRFATYVVAATAFYSVASAMRDGIKEAVDFQHQMVRLSQTTGKSLGGLKNIRKEIDSLATGFGISSRDLSQVSVTLAQAGFSAKETAEALRALGKTTLSPSFENITKTTEGAIAAMRQFGIETARLEGVLGSINTVAAKFAVESGDIITAIQKAGGTFATLDKGLKPGEQSLREFIAIFSAVRDTTRESADTIATGMRTIFARVQSPKVIDFLKQYDIQLQDAQDGQKLFIGGLESILEISGKLKNINTRSADFAAIVQQLGGQRQVSKTIPLFTQADKIREAVRIANTGQKSLSENQETAQQSLQVQLNKTRENFLKLIRDLGDTKSFQFLTSSILGLTNNLIKLADVFKEIIPLATVFFAGKAIAPILTGVGPKGGSVLTGISKELFRPGHGPPYRRSSGGIIPGYGDHDTVPAMLTPGEFVLNKKAVHKIGVGNLKRWNSGIPSYSEGGNVKPEFTTTQLYGNDLFGKRINQKEVSEIFRRISKASGIDYKQVFGKRPIFKLSKKEIKRIIEANNHEVDDVAGAFYPNLRRIGLNPNGANTGTLVHEFAHGVDLHLGGKNYASEIPGTTQYYIAEALKKHLLKEGNNKNYEKYYSRNREVFAHYAQRQHPEVLKSLFFKQGLSKEDVYNQLGLDPITGEFNGTPAGNISRMGQGIDYVKKFGEDELPPKNKSRTRVEKPQKFVQPKGPYGPFKRPSQAHTFPGDFILPPRGGYMGPDAPFEQPEGPYGPFQQKLLGHTKFYAAEDGRIGVNRYPQTHGPNGPTPPHGPPPHSGPAAPYGPFKNNFTFNRVGAQRGRRLTAQEYQKEVLRDLHRTHGVTYAIKNAKEEARSRLVNAVATQFEQRGYSPLQAIQKAGDYVNRNKLSDVLVGANGQGLGFNDNITNGLDTSLTNRTRKLGQGATSYYRSRIQPGLHRLNNSRFIRGVGAFGNSNAGLLALGGGALASQYALGSVEGNSRSKRNAGAVGDVVTSTLSGAAFGAAAGPWGILGGAVIGLAAGLTSMHKKMKEAKVNDAIEDFGKALGDINKDLEKNGKANFSKLNPRDILDQRHAAGLSNHYLYSTAESYGEGVKNFDKANADITKEGLKTLSLYIEKNADKLFANSGDSINSQTGTAYGRLLSAKGGKFDDLIHLFNKMDKGTNYNQVAKGLLESEAYKRALVELNEEIDFNIQKFTDLASVVETAVDATSKFDDRLHSLGDFSALRTSYSGVLGRPGGVNVSDFNAAARSAGGIFGGARGDELAEAAITFNQFSRELPEILRSIKESPQSKFAEGLQNNNDFQNLGSGVFAKKIREYIIATAHEQEHHIGKDAAANSVDLTKNLLSKFDDAAKVLDYAAKQFSEQQNRFSGGLAEVASSRLAIGNQRDTIPALQLEAARARADFAGSNVGFADLSAPFSARQGRLAGGLGGNPRAIAQQIARNTAERASISALGNPTKDQIEHYHELGRASAELRQALEELADTSKSNAAAQERLAQIEAERSDRLGFAKSIFTSDVGERGKLVQGLHLARFAVGGGDVSRLSSEQRQRVVSTLEGFGNTSNLFGSGKNGQQLLEGILEKFGGKLPQGLEGERQKQQQTILDNINRAIEAQKEAISLAENETSTKLDLIRQTFDEFIQKLKEATPFAGKAEGFAAGGSIFSPRGTDTIPAMLTPGEFVMRRDAVQRIGVGQLQAMNNGYAKGGLVYLAKGGLPYNGLNKFLSNPPNEAEKAFNKRVGTSNAFGFNPNRRDGNPEIGEFRDYSAAARAGIPIQEISPTVGTPQGPNYLGQGKKFYELYKNQLSRNGRKYKEFAAARKEFRKQRQIIASYSRDASESVSGAALSEHFQNRGIHSNKPESYSQFRKDFLAQNPGAKRRQLSEAYAGARNNYRADIGAFKDLRTKTLAINAILNKGPSPHENHLSEAARQRVAENKAKREAAKASSKGVANEIVTARHAARERKSAENAEKINQRIAELKAAEQAKRENKVAHFATGGVVGVAPSSGGSHDSSLSQLGKAIQELSNSPLVEALKNFPHEISLNASHKVEVIFNGAEILQKLMPEIQQIAVDEAKKALRKMLRDKFPEAGTNV